jgi:hypothetical protein
MGVEHYRQSEEKHHVRGKDEENHEPDALEQFAGAAAPHAFPFIVVAIASAAGGTPVDGRFTAYAWVFSLGFNRIPRKSAGHGWEPQSESDYTDIEKDAADSALVVFCPVEGHSYIGLAARRRGYEIY